jgi:hypothetical protein
MDTQLCPEGTGADGDRRGDNFRQIIGVSLPTAEARGLSPLPTLQEWIF